MKIFKLLLLLVLLGGCSTKYYKQTASTLCTYMMSDYRLAQQCKLTATEMIENAEKNSKEQEKK